MKQIVPLMSLPLVALASPAIGQDCNAECVASEQIERDQPADVHSVKPRANRPVSVSSADDIIVVTGRLPDTKSDLTENMITVPLLERPGTRIENTLQQVPGLQQFRRSDARSANPTSQGVTLRGLGGNASSRALLFLDDVPQADPFGGWVSWPSYDALNLASVRVRKGGGQASTGPGALAGVIELDSAQYREIAELALAYGSRNSMDGKASYAANLGSGSVTAAASYARGDGFNPIIANQRGSVDRRAPYEQAGVSLRGVAPLNSSTELQANLRAFTDTRDRGVDFSDNANGGVDASLRLVDRTGDWHWSGTAYVQVREFSSEFGAIAADRNSVTQTLDQFATPSTGLGARFEVRPPVGEQVELRLGGEWRRTSGETREFFTYVAGAPTRFRTAGGQTDSYGGFAELSYEPWEALTLSAGGRLDRWSIRDGFRREVNIGGTVRSDDRFADRSGTEWTGRAGLGWQFADGFSLRGAAYRAWRLPTLNELYRPFRVGADATAANENLRPEKVEGVDAGLAYDNGSFNLGVTVFRNRLNGAIANVTLGQGPGNFPGVGFVAAGGTYRQRRNLDAILSSGVEADVGVDLAQGLKVRLGYAYVDAEVRGSTAAAGLSGLRPAQVPRHFASATLAYDRGRIAADVTARYIGAQFEDDANSRPLDDALTLDMGASLKLSDAFSLVLRGENLFDARVETAISSSGVIERATPRTLWLGLRWNFD